MLIDTHCHYNHPQMNQNQSDVPDTLQRARLAGVKAHIVVGYDLESSRRAVALADKYSDIAAAVGLHPHDASEWSTEFESLIYSWANNPNVVAIGEIGLDYYRNLSPKDKQQEVFKRQLDLAEHVQLPVIIHCREAYDDALGILNRESVKKLGGVMHCWAGEPEQALATVRLGMFLGIGGTSTYVKATNVHASIEATPLDCLLFETDAPYLTPMPFRGKRNEPSYLPLVAERVAELKRVPVSSAQASVWNNSVRCFPRLQCITEASL